MIAKGFSEEEVNKFISFLNHVAENAKFDGQTVKSQIEFVRLLQIQQSIILPKMQEMIVGDVKVHEAPKKEVKAKKSGKK